MDLAFPPKSCWIAGKVYTCHGDATRNIINPTSAAPITVGGRPYDAADCGPAVIASAVKSSDAAFKDWSTKTTGHSRAVLLRKIADLVDREKQRLATIETLNCGKPLAESVWDIEDVSACFRYFAGEAEKLDGRQDTPVDIGDADYACRLRYDPVGVVAAVVPWNYPLLMATWKIAPALAAGCTIVVKPSELTPLTLLELALLSDEAGLPAGVFNVVTGAGATGATLVAHPKVRKVSFTGSEATGVKVAHAAADGLKKMNLELGGKSASIVFADAVNDEEAMQKVVEWVMFGCFWTNGQICSATSRLLLQADIADKFIEKLVARTKSIKIGNPLDEDVKLGPLVSKNQQTKVLNYIQGAALPGGGSGKVLCGGHIPPKSPGFYVSPTIIHVTDLTSPVWTEEIFGPVMSIATFTTEEDAVGKANDSKFGLANAVFTKDTQRLERVTASLDCGIVWEQCSQPAAPQLPWGGTKRSGVGRDLHDLSAYLEPKQVVRSVGPDPLGWYLPAAKL
eukprot:g5099.t1